MKRFSFSLQSVADHRTVKREAAERELVAAASALSLAHAALERAIEARNTALDSYTAFLESGKIDPEELSMHINHIALLVERENESQARVNLLEREKENRRQGVIAASRDEKAISKLRDRHRDRHNSRAARIEQIALDEMATLSFVRRSK